MGNDWHVATIEEVFYPYRHADLNTAQIPPELMSCRLRWVGH